MKLFLTKSLYLVGTALTLGGAAMGVFELLCVFSDTLERLVGRLTTTGIALTSCVLVLHSVFAAYRLRRLPNPFECSWSDIATGLMFGGSALLFLAVGLPAFLLDMPMSLGVLAQWVSFAYGLIFGGTVTALFLSLTVMRVSEALIDPLDDVQRNMRYAVQRRLRKL